MAKSTNRPTIHYAIIPTAFGDARFACQGGKLCWLDFLSGLAKGKDDDFKKQLRGANLVENSSAVAPFAEMLADYLSGKAESFAPPLAKASGETYTDRVLTFLHQIPAGAVMDYGDVATALGKNRGHYGRPTGQCIGRNRIAIVIPCHRVVGSDRKLGGFRWGLELKKKLLEREGVRFDSNGRVTGDCFLSPSALS